jgi:hypothetical protein
MDYHMKGTVVETLFPQSYLVDEVEEQLPHNGKIKNVIQGRKLCDKTIAHDSITQRMSLITSKIRTFDFYFGENRWQAESGCDFGEASFTQLISVHLNESNIVSNIEDGKFKKLSIELHAKHPYFDFIKIQCVLSLQNNPSNVKHICYLEIKAKNATVTVDGKVLAAKLDGGWSIQFVTTLPWCV